MPRRCIAVLAGLLFVLGSLGTVRALDQSALPGGAPGPRSEPFQPKGFVRIVDGDSLEVLIDGKRVPVAVLGVDAPSLSTPCGKATRAELQGLVGRGVVLEDDQANQYDARKRRVYRVSTPDGRSVAATLVGAGLARTTGLGPEASTLAAVEAKARQSQTGCVWGGAVPAPRPAAAQGAGARPSGAQAASDQVTPSAAASVLPNFADDVMVSGLSFPSAFAFLPDGRILIAEKEGRIRLVTNNVLQPTPVLEIESRVNNYWDRGILGLAIDPDFSSNHRFYVFYTYENNASDFEGPKSGQLARFELQPDNTADPNAGTVILGTQPGAGCAGPPSTADCIPSEGASHGGGALRFGSDGTLFVSSGDAASFGAVDPLALRAQDVDSLAGKILRVNTNGKGLSSNPHWNNDENHPRSKVWARGFRNPFRMTVRPGGGPLFVGDVGWGAWEEVDVVPSNTNAGWPCYEGAHVQEGYKDFPLCASLIGQNPSPVRAPLIEWSHTGPGGAALVGAFYTGSAFPAQYQGALFYADYALGWIRSVQLDGNQQVVGSSAQFAGAIPGPVQIESGPDGALWYLAIGTGELRRIHYVGNYTPVQCPNGQWRAEYHLGKELFGTPRVARCEASIDHFWDWNPPVGEITADDFSARWTGRFSFGNDTYDFSARSDDGARIYVDGELLINDWSSGAANTITAPKVMTAGEHTIVAEYFEDCCPAEMRVSWTPRTPSSPPSPTITSPAAGTTFKVGDVIQLQGSASDAQQGQIPAANLRWDVIQKHCPGFGSTCHDHPLLTLTGATGQFTAPDHGDGSFFEIRLTATDSGGLTGVTSRQVDPRTVQVTLATSPSVGTVVYDGTSHTPPYTATTIAGSSHTIGAQPPAGQQFAGWAHGGAQQQNVTVGEQNVTYTASIGSSCSPRPRVNLTTVPAGSGARQVTVSTTTVPGAATNVLRSIRFDETRLSVIEAPGRQPSGAPLTIPYSNGETQATFVIRETQPGAILVRFTVTDGCGPWPTFVGTGSSSGF